MAVASGAEALAILRASSAELLPHVIMSDLGMPARIGFR